MPRELLIMQNSFQWGTAEGQTLEIENAIRSNARGLKIEGQTYQNLLSETKSLGKFVYNDITGEYTLTDPTVGTWNAMRISYTRPIQAGEKLLIRINIVKNTIEATQSPIVKITFSDSNGNLTGYKGVESGFTGLLEHYCDGATVNEIDGNGIHISTNNYTSGELVVKDIQVIPVSENPIGSTELPTSINGIESVAERESNNLLENVKWHDGWIDVMTGAFDSTHPSYCNAKYSDLISIDVNNNYYFSLTSNDNENVYRIRPYDADGNYVTPIDDTGNPILGNSFDIFYTYRRFFANVKYIRILLLDPTGYPPLDSLIFSQNIYTEGDSYPIIIAQSNNETDGMTLPNGVKNTIENGTVIKRVGKMIVDGTNNISISAVRTNTIRFFIANSTIKNTSASELPFLCDSLPKTGTIWNYDVEGIYQDGNGHRFVASISTTKVAGTTVNDIKTYFKENPMTLYYELATPVTQPLALTKINLPQPLRSLPNGVCDEVVGNKLIQRVYELKLDENFDFSKPVQMGGAPTDTSLWRIDIEVSIPTVKGNLNSVTSNMFPYLYIHDLPGGSSAVTQECVSNHSANRFGINIIIKRSRLTSLSVDGFKEWCIANNFKMLYQLETPIVHEITQPIIPISKGGNIVTTINNIKPNLYIKYKKSKK